MNQNVKGKPQNTMWSNDLKQLHHTNTAHTMGTTIAINMKKIKYEKSEVLI